MEIKKTGEFLYIGLTLREKFFSFHGNFKIPSKDIVSISEGRANWYIFEIRIPGVFMPGIIKAGSYFYWRKREWRYWYVTGWSRFVYTINLSNNPYKKLVLGSRKKLNIEAS